MTALEFLNKKGIYLATCYTGSQIEGDNQTLYVKDLAALMEDFLKESSETHIVRAKEVYDNLCEQHDFFIGAGGLPINEDSEDCDYILSFKQPIGNFDGTELMLTAMGFNAQCV